MKLKGKTMDYTIIPVLVWIMVLLFTAPCFGNSPSLNLSPEEESWLSEHHTVRVRVGHAPPYMLTDGEIRGMAIDYLTHIFNINGIKLQYINSSEITWPKALEFIKQHEVVDMVPTAKITENRKREMIFTEEYIFAPWVIFTRSDADFISSIDDLNGKTVAVEEGYVMHQRLQQDYPMVNLKVISAALPDYTEIPIKELSTGLVDAYIGNLLSTTFFIQTKGYANVKVAAPTPFDDHNQAMAIRSDWPELVGIINKTIASMSPDEHSAIRNRWLSIRYEYGIDKAYVAKWVLGIAGLASLFIGFVLIWNKRLQSEVAFRKSAEMALRESEARTGGVLNALSSSIVLLDETGKIIAVNEAWKAFAAENGCPDEAFYLGYNYLAVCERATEHGDQDRFAEQALQGIRMVMQRGKTHFSMEYPCHSPREQRWFFLRATPYAGVSPNQVVVAHENITERKLAEDALRQSEERFRVMVEGAPDPVFVQTERRFAYLNSLALELFGAERESDILGQPVLHRVHPEYHKSALERIRRLNEDRQSVLESFEQKFFRLDGSEVWVETTGQPIVFDGKNGAVVFVRDITDRKRAEVERLKLEAQLQQAQKMESVGRLAGGVAHDYNNMLSVIIGFTELAMDKVSSNDPLREDLEEVLNAARRSTEITRQLLAFARRQTIDPKLIDLNETVEGMLKMLRRLIGEDINLSWQPGPGRMPVFMDPSQLDQLLANMCVNARDAIGGVGKLTIETNHVRFDEEYCADHAGFIPGEFILLAISDNGCGMDQETLDNIFEPFFTTKGVGEGTGLGLSTVFGIVKQNQGFINVYSEPRKGTTFKIYLPLYAAEYAGMNVQKPIEIPAGNGKTVLIVEDEPSILKLAGRILKLLGYSALTASTPGEAMALAEENEGRIHLLITDVVMPEMNGRELAEILKTHYPKLKILFMSGYTANVIAHHGVLDEGINFIQKPFSTQDLAVKVAEALES